MCLSIAIFFLVTTTALLVVTVTSDRPRSTLFRALAWSAVASLASTFAWTAVGGFQPVPSAIFTVQTFLYGIATLPLRNWAADYAWQLEQEQSKRRVRELMVEFDEQLEQMEESTRLRVIDACNRRLERGPPTRSGRRSLKRSRSGSESVGVSWTDTATWSGACEAGGRLREVAGA